VSSNEAVKLRVGGGPPKGGGRKRGEKWGELEGRYEGKELCKKMEQSGGECADKVWPDG